MKFMNNKSALEEKLKDLKLTKRTFVLEGKDTQEIDCKIKLIEQEIKCSSK